MSESTLITALWTVSVFAVFLLFSCRQGTVEPKELPSPFQSLHLLSSHRYVHENMDHMNEDDFISK